jgi:hypothetical protein
MIVTTYIYKDFANPDSSTFEFRRSVDALGLELHNVAPKTEHVGNGEVLRLLGEFYGSLPSDTPILYADGADSFIFYEPHIPSNYILYSTEKNVWPPTEELREAWAKYPDLTPWRYLNGGGYAGPAGLLAEFFEIGGLTTLGDIPDGQAQGAQARAFFKAKEQGFPICLDYECNTFQTIGFMEPTDFEVLNVGIRNTITNTMPAVFHGNGRTPMGWVYNVKK